MNKTYYQSAIYKNFKENINIKLKVAALIYVPSYLLTAICFPPSESTGMSIPHIDIAYQGKWTSD